jgi:hypothetical protein
MGQDIGRSASQGIHGCALILWLKLLGAQATVRLCFLDRWLNRDGLLTSMRLRTVNGER